MNKKNIAAVLIIIAVGIAAYANCLSNKFVWDDKLLIENNDSIKSFSNIKYIFTKDLFHSDINPTGYYRPIQVISYMIDHLLWGREALGYHITSVAIQIANSILVFYLCLLMLGGVGISLFVALVFCVHPAFVPVVTYISGRADLLGLFFALLYINTALKYMIKGSGVASLFAALIFYALSILSKEYYLIAPLFVFIYLFSFKDKARQGLAVKTFLISSLSIAVIYMLLRATVLNFHQKMGVMAEQAFLTRLSLFPYILTRYIGTLVFPIDLGMEKKLVYSSLFEARFIISYLTPVAIFTAINYLYKKRNMKALFLLGWFVIGILPVANLLFPLKAFIADHWTYMASIGLFALVALSAHAVFVKLGDDPVLSRTRSVLAILIIAAFTFLTIRENVYWKDEEAFFSRTLAKSPRSARTNYNMGKLYDEKGDYVKALEAYTTAIKESPKGFAHFYNARAMAYRKTNDLERALADCLTAVKMEPSNALYHVNLGGIYAELGMIDKARAEWKEALKLDPRNELARKNLELIGDTE